MEGFANIAENRRSSILLAQNTVHDSANKGRWPPKLKEHRNRKFGRVRAIFYLESCMPQLDTHALGIQCFTGVRAWPVYVPSVSAAIGPFWHCHVRCSAQVRRNVLVWKVQWTAQCLACCAHSIPRCARPKKLEIE